MKYNFNPIKPGGSFFPAENLDLNHLWTIWGMNMKLYKCF